MKTWHYVNPDVNCLKNMPKKTGDYILVTNMGVTFSFYWIADKKEMRIININTHFDGTDYIENGEFCEVVYDYFTHGEFLWASVPKVRNRDWN